jgi:ABC-type nitrate/sulfonate/bicarbonate transport system substrate-binding protein
MNVISAYAKRILRLGAIVSLAGLAPAQAQELQLVKIGIPSPLNTILAFWMADEAGFYKQQGIRVEFKTVEGGSRGAQMIRSGEIDVMQAGLSSVIEINKQGGDIRTIGSLSNVNRFVLFGAPGAAKVDDIKGGVVAISSAGSETDTTVAIALEKLGLKRSDVQVKEFGGGGARLQALKAGQAKASPLNEPSSSLARQQGLPVLVDLAAEKYPWLFSSIVVSEAAVREKRAMFLRFMKATIEGNHLAIAQPERAKPVLARELKLKDPKLVDIIYEDFRAGSPPTTEPTKDAIDNVIRFNGADVARRGDYVESSLLDELKKTGFFDELARKYRL